MWTAYDRDGRAYVVELCQPVSTVTGFSGEPRVIRRRPFVSVDGRRARRQAKGRYRLPGAGVEVTCDDPDAP